jgi:hypothetical protein
MKKRLFKDIHLKSGKTLPKGLYVEVEPINEFTCKVLSDIESPGFLKTYFFKYTSVFPAPSQAQLVKWMMNMNAKTPAGKTVEVDGFDPEGFPSWLIILHIS